DIVQRTGMSERTLYRDLYDLRRTIPIVHVDGGYRMIEGATQRPLPATLTPAEHAVLKLALDSPVLRKAPGIGSRLKTLLAKLDAVACQSEETPAALALASVDRTGRMPDDLMEALEHAVGLRRAVSLRYASLSGRTDRWRGVDPYRVFHRGDAWYLVGRCHVHDEPRIFRLDRIRGVRPFARRFHIPEDFSLDDFLKDSWNVFRGKRNHEVVLRFDGDLAPLIQNAQHHASEEVQAVADGEIEYRVRLSHLDEIARWVVGFGGRCRVVKPEALRRKVCGLAAEAELANSAKPRRQPRSRQSQDNA
ncbi:MAG: helix-turn-helix transcriptional regulator, partial [Thermoanaerobaculia bacterium]